jgi:hypothetical protein
MKEIFTGISGAIENNVAAIRWVDFDLGQFEAPELPPVSWPAVLIGFAGGPFQRIGGQGELAELDIYLLLGCKVRERTHSKTNPSFRTEGLEHMDLITSIHEAINGLAGNTFRDLRRTGFSNQSRADFRIYRIDYRCLYCYMPESEYTAWPTASDDADLDLQVNWDMVEPNE